MGDEPTLEKGAYRHYKGGLYEIVQLACHTETLEWYVVYQSQERKKNRLPSVWIRPYEMFVGNVEVDGKTIPRFKRVSE